MIVRTPPAEQLVQPSTEWLNDYIECHENPTWKRILDVIGVVAMIPVAVPVALATAVFIKIVSRGPVLFTQNRVGHGGEDFRIYKFRTMHVPKKSRDATHRMYVTGRKGAKVAIDKPDNRGELIRGGAFLRCYSIDEVPQLLNVLRGEMSLVGPRPDVLRLEDYEQWQLRRFVVLPGMTGLWQVSGKNRLSFEQMVELDIEYAETRSLRNDIRILLSTLRVLLSAGNE